MGLLGLLLAEAPAHAAPSFRGLGYGGGDSSAAFGVSRDGSVVVGRRDSASGTEAFRWTQGGGMVGLGDLAGGLLEKESSALGVSGNGSVVVGTGTTDFNIEAFRWTQGGGMVRLGSTTLVVNSVASAASGDGSVVVGTTTSPSGGSSAFRWTSAGGMLQLGDLPGGGSLSFSGASGVSGDGAVVVGYGDSNLGTEAFRWTSGGGMVGLGDLPDGLAYSFATGVSANGSVVVGVSGSGSGYEAFRWTQGGGMVGLGDLAGGSFNSQANAVSGDGSIVVGAGSSDCCTRPLTEAFIWDEVHAMRSLKDVLVNDYGLDLTDWSLDSANAISIDGTAIVGEGTHAGIHEAWIAVIPEPSTGLLFGAGLAALAAARRHRERA